MDIGQSATASAESMHSQGGDPLPANQAIDDYEREATELSAIDHTSSHHEAGVQEAHIAIHFRTKKKAQRSDQELPWYHPLVRWWSHYINLAVPFKECRDHLANERTFLAYTRTSLALSMMGVTVTQLLRLQHSIDPSHVYGYHVLGRPLGVFFQIAAMAMSIIGGHRYWRQQMCMARGKVWAGGWEIYLIMVSMLIVSHVSCFRKHHSLTSVNPAHSRPFHSVACS